MNQRLINAFYINFINLICSEAMKLTTIITFLIACIFSFWPWLNRQLFEGKESSLTGSDFFVTLGICLVFLFFMVLVITRIGAQVGFQKGSMVTELILTSISRKQLYIANIVSSFAVVMVVMFIVYIPLMVAGMINDPKMTMTISGITGATWLFLLMHALLTSLIMVILAVSITSIVKKSEDTGPYLLVVLIPFLLSNIYFVVKGDMYKGVLSILNYIPICSLMPAVGTSMLNGVDGRMEMLILFTDVIWCIFLYGLGERFFTKNIAVK